ncbi:MAG TPA: prolyl oligopeptidase family serine peptidase, partial [Thermomicrobiales bacterium]|nr:prolyl oligopeptidase family serine peptidase [Thermomicrobiales bacterium]
MKRRTSRRRALRAALPRPHAPTLHALTLCALVLLPLLPAASRPAAAAGPLTLAGVLGDAPYRIVVPANWNGTLVLYSHGYIPAGVPNQAQDAPDAATASWLLEHGYALAGSAYSATGWAVAEALDDQVALLDYFSRRVGPPRRVIAWGQSLGGLVTAGLAQRYPDRFVGALPMCGILAGAVGAWNEGLDAAFAFKTLVAPDSAIQLVHIAGEGGPNLQLAQRALDAAQQTPQGRARIALAAALANIPGWYDPSRPEPAAGDYAAREEAQYLWSARSLFLYAFGFRAELERRAGGNPSWNTGVDYRRQLAGSIDYSE